MTEGFSAFGTTLKWNAQPLAELTSIGGPSISIEDIDLTSHDSLSATAGFREFVAGLRDGGEVTIEGNFIPGNTAGQRAFITDLKAGTKREAIITGPAAAAFTWTFTALVTAFDMSYPFDDKLSFTATLKVSGKPVLGISFADNLSALTITTATLLPSFAAATYAYTATTIGASVTVTPTCATADSIEVWAWGVLVSVLASGGTSSAISAGATGTNTPIQIRVKKAGKMDRRYDITLVKTA